MIVALLFAGGLLAIMLVTEIILTGIHHINLWIERRNDEKETPRYKKYEKLFKYNP